MTVYVKAKNGYIWSPSSEQLEVTITQTVPEVTEEDRSISAESIDIPEQVNVDINGNDTSKIQLPSNYSIEIQGLQ